jgi:hypothetical protein
VDLNGHGGFGDFPDVRPMSDVANEGRMTQE